MLSSGAGAVTSVLKVCGLSALPVEALRRIGATVAPTGTRTTSVVALDARSSVTGTALPNDTELAAEFAERTVLLADGRVIADGPTTEILAGGWYFATETARILGGAAGVLLPEDGAALLQSARDRAAAQQATEEVGRPLAAVVGLAIRVGIDPFTLGQP